MIKEKYYCYILSNKNRTVLYIGLTKNLTQRIIQHQKGLGSLFAKKYSVGELVYFEEFTEKKKARKRELQLKNWRKDWKWDLVKSINPNLKTLEIY